jgi:hypothetical protein
MSEKVFIGDKFIFRSNSIFDQNDASQTPLSSLVRTLAVQTREESSIVNF